MDTLEQRNPALDKFAGLLTEAIDPVAGKPLEPDSRFREMDGWDSIASVSVVAMIYAEFDIQISGDELMACETVASLKAVVESKLSDRS